MTTPEMMEVAENLVGETLQVFLILNKYTFRLLTLNSHAQSQGQWAKCGPSQSFMWPVRTSKM